MTTNPLSSPSAAASDILAIGSSPNPEPSRNPLVRLVVFIGKRLSHAFIGQPEPLVPDHDLDTYMALKADVAEISLQIARAQKHDKRHSHLDRQRTQLVNGLLRCEERMKANGTHWMIFGGAL